ncbi:MAG: PLxRFG domain-containing protein, partial [Magnetococcus sp. YQC-5]
MKAKAQGNLSAITLAKQITDEGRAATPDEQAILAKYVGWGGLSGAFPNSEGKFNPTLKEIGAQLKATLTEEEYATARRSTQYAHYTSEPVVNAMWKAVERMGFTGGKIFEPGMGVGNFIGMMPEGLAQKSEYTGIEMDAVSARIAKLLYPQSNIQEADFTKFNTPKNAFDLVIGNPPFADIAIKSDPEYAKNKFLLHDYFFAKSMDALRPGGILAFISSAGTLNKTNPAARNYLADRAEMVGAIRLPGDAFKKNAGTEVTTDIIFLRKRVEGEQAGDRSWTGTERFSGPDKQGGLKSGYRSKYFGQHPEMVLGQEGFFDTLHLGRYAVRMNPGTDFKQLLNEAVEKLTPNVIRNVDQKQATRTDTSTTLQETKPGSYYIKDGLLYQFINGQGVVIKTRGPGVEGGKTYAEKETIKRLIPIRDALREVYAADASQDPQRAAAARKELNRVYDAFVAERGPINKTVVHTSKATPVQQEKARNAARELADESGAIFDEGTFDPTAMLAAGKTLTEIAKARQMAKEQAGDAWYDGSIDPADLANNEWFTYPNIDPFKEDQESYRLRAIEKYDPDTGKAEKREVFFQNPIALEKKAEINTVKDALLFALNQTGRVDMEIIMRESGKSMDEVIKELGDTIFLVPGTRNQFVTGDEYLSGPVKDKLREALTAAEENPAFDRNVEALQAAQPKPLPAEDIFARLGMHWIPKKTVKEFADALGLTNVQVMYSEGTGEWSVTGNEWTAAATSDWGTQDKSAIELLEMALNKQLPKVWTKGGPDGKTRILDVTKTDAAVNKLNDLQERFEAWAWENQERSDMLAEIYNDRFNNSVPPGQVDGSYLTTPGISATWKWMKHQLSVIARIIMHGNTYIAHAVGAGKTAEMIAAGMEMRRLGMAKKPMFTVPNHMLLQFTQEFYEQYPNAKLMVADEEQFHTSRRKQFVADVANQDLDAVIITHSAFGKIPVSPEFQDSLIKEQIDLFRNKLEEAKGTRDEESKFTVKKIENMIQKFEQKLSANDSKQRDNTFNFEQLGVDFLFVDEAHKFRKLSFATVQNLKGIDPIGSQMAWDLFVKTRYLESQNPGRNLVLASGTPITNTMGELYTLQRYIQPNALKKAGINSFDDWAALFGAAKTQNERGVTGAYSQITRFAEFINVADLSRMVRQVMDVVTGKQLDEFITRPQMEGGKRIMHVLEELPILKAYTKHLAKRLEAIQNRSGKPQKGDDILLKIITNGRQAAFDMRLIDASYPNDPGSKLNTIVRNVFDIWEKTKDHTFYKPGSDIVVDKGPATQIIFADQGVNPKGGFHGYARMVNDLVLLGVPRNEIAIANDYPKTTDKQKLFGKVKRGEIRILIGSSEKLGTGTNVQDRLYAIHNADPQWFPSADEQRVGRIIRKGNLNKSVEIHDYGVKGTYDGQMWGIMAQKGGFIEAFMRGDPNMRRMEDLSEKSMYEQASAMTVTDPRVMELVNAMQDLDTAMRKRSAYYSDQSNIRYNIAALTRDISGYEKRISRIEADIASRIDTSGNKFMATINGTGYTKRDKAGDAILNAMLDAKGKAEQTNSEVFTTIGTIGGFKLSVEVQRGMDKRNFLDPSLVLQLQSGKRLWWGHSVANSTGIVQAVESAIRSLDNDLAVTKEKRQKSATSLAEYEKRVGTPFTGQERIDELRTKVSELEADLRANPFKVGVGEDDKGEHWDFGDISANLAEPHDESSPIDKKDPDLATEQHEPNPAIEPSPTDKKHPDWATEHEQETGGRVVYSGSDVALLEGFGTTTGNPLYVGIARKFRSRTNRDIEVFNGNLFSKEEKEELIAAKKALLEQDKKAFDKRPNGPFHDKEMLAASDNMPINLVNTAKGWIELLGMHNTRIFLTTMEDASDINQAQKHGLNGPFAAVRGAVMDGAQQGGSRKIANNDFYVAIKLAKRTSQNLEILAHEIGHIFEQTEYTKADMATKNAINDAYKNWLKTAGQTTGKDWVLNMRAHTMAKLTRIKDGGTGADAPPYWRSFSEFFADQVSRWAVSSEKPMSVVETFFARVASGLRRLYSSLAGQRFLPNAVFKKYLDARSNPDLLQGAMEKEKEPALRASLLVPHKPASGGFFNGGATQGDISVTEIKSALEPILSQWQNRPEVMVVDSFKDLPQSIQKWATSRDVQDRMNAAWKGNQIYIVANMMKNAEHAQRILLHEGVVHYGLRQMLNNTEFDKLLSDVAKAHEKEVQAVADLRGLDMQNPEDRMEAAEELLATLAEPEKNPSLMDRIWVVVQRAIRALGFKLHFTHPEIRVLLAASAQNLRDGTRISAVEAHGDINRASIQDIKESSKYWVSDAITKAKPFTLGLLGGRQLTEIYAHIFPNAGKQLKELESAIQDMGAKINKEIQEAGILADRWLKLGKKTADQLAEVMHLATVYEFHPDEKFSDGDLKMAKLSYASAQRAVKAFQQGHDLNDLNPGEREDFETLKKAVQDSKASTIGNGLAENVGIAMMNQFGEKWILGNLLSSKALSDASNTQEDRDNGAALFNGLDAKTKAQYRQAAKTGSAKSQRKLNAFKNGHEMGKLDVFEKNEYERLQKWIVRSARQEKRESERAKQAEIGILLYDNLTEEAKQVYKDARNAYVKTEKDRLNSLITRIEQEGIPLSTKGAGSIAALKYKFEKAAFSRGPYFPLQRFGKFTVYATGRGMDPYFSMEETPKDQRAMATTLRQMGYTTIEMGWKGEFTEAQKETSPQFVKDVIKSIGSNIINKPDEQTKENNMMLEFLQREVWQAYLRTIPQLSISRKFIHRKKTLGWSTDALRGFAQHMDHASRQIAKMVFAPKMQAALDTMAEEIAGKRTVFKKVEINGRKVIKEFHEKLEGNDRVAPENRIKAEMVLNEMVQRHKLVMNPPGSVIANTANAVGFLIYLGFSPAAGIVNLMQTPMVALPLIGAKYGFKATLAAYVGVMKEYGSGLKDGGYLTDKTSLPEEERRLLTKMVNDGDITLTQVMDLIGLGSDSGANPL